MGAMSVPPTARISTKRDDVFLGKGRGFECLIAGLPTCHYQIQQHQKACQVPQSDGWGWTGGCRPRRTLHDELLVAPAVLDFFFFIPQLHGIA